MEHPVVASAVTRSDLSLRSDYRIKRSNRLRRGKRLERGVIPFTKFASKRRGSITTSNSSGSNETSTSNTQFTFKFYDSNGLPIGRQTQAEPVSPSVTESSSENSFENETFDSTSIIWDSSSKCESDLDSNRNEQIELEISDEEYGNVSKDHATWTEKNDVFECNKCHNVDFLHHIFHAISKPKCSDCKYSPCSPKNVKHLILPILQEYIQYLTEDDYWNHCELTGRLCILCFSTNCLSWNTMQYNRKIVLVLFPNFIQFTTNSIRLLLWTRFDRYQPNSWSTSLFIAIIQ